MTIGSASRKLTIFVAVGLLLGFNSLQASDTEDVFSAHGAKTVHVADIIIVPEEQRYTLNLGTHPTSRRIKFELGMVNRTNRPFAIKGVDASCGCLVGHIANSDVAIGGRTGIRAIMELNSYPSTVRRSLVLRVGETPGDVISIDVVVSTQLPFDFEPRKLQIENTGNEPHPVEFTITVNEGGDFAIASLNVTSLTGYLSNLATSQEKDGIWKLAGTFIPRRALHGGQVIEKLRFETSEGVRIGEFAIALEHHRDLEFRPSTLMLTGKGNGLRGLAIITGTEHQVSRVVSTGVQAKFVRNGEVIEPRIHNVRVQKRGLQTAVLTINLDATLKDKGPLRGAEVVFESAAFDVPRTLPVDVPY